MEKSGADMPTSAHEDALERIESAWIRLKSLEVVSDATWSFPLGYVSEHCLIILARGHAQCVVDGAHRDLAAGSALLCVPGQLLQAVVAGAKSRVELYLLRFNVRAGGAGANAEPWQEADLPVSGTVMMSDSAGMVRDCQKMAMLWHGGERLRHLQAQGLFQQVMYQMLQDLLAAQPSPEADPDASRAVHRTKLYIDQHYERNVTIDELAEMAGLSRYYYMRSFKTTYGVSAMDYLTERRIEQAKRLMEKTDIRLRDIAKQVGYQDEYYFGRKFKQKIGIPPAAYMKSRKRKITAYSFPNIGQLLALRIVPYAAPMDHSWTDQYRRKYDSDVIVKLSHDYAFNLEALRQAEPDAIVGIDLFVPDAEREKLAQIAPTFFVPWTSMDWRGHLQSAAAFLGNEAEAAIWLEEYERKVSRAGEQLAADVRTGETVLVLQLHKRGLYAYGNRSIAGVLYEDLGLAPPAGIALAESHTEITAAKLQELDADRIYLMITDSVNPAASWEELRLSPAWANLKAVRTGRLELMPAYLWFEYSAYTQSKFLDSLIGLYKGSFPKLPPTCSDKASGIHGDLSET